MPLPTVLAHGPACKPMVASPRLLPGGWAQTRHPLPLQPAPPAPSPAALLLAASGLESAGARSPYAARGLLPGLQRSWPMQLVPKQLIPASHPTLQHRDPCHQALAGLASSLRPGCCLHGRRSAPCPREPPFTWDSRQGRCQEEAATRRLEQRAPAALQTKPCSPRPC